MNQSTFQDFECSGVECPVCNRRFKSKRAFGPHFRSAHPDKHCATERVREFCGGNPKAALIRWYYGDDLTTREISDLTGVNRDSLGDVFERLGVETEDWGIGKWVDANPEAHRQVAQENGHKGTEAREENGMAGATGQDNPNWRGGKSVYDAVKKQLEERSWNYLQDHERTDECYNCGAKSGQHDLHHIIPIMSGGTNESWNLMTLCDSCHRKAELFIRQYDAFDPVLVE